jgi:hypothetical protein
VTKRLKRNRGPRSGFNISTKKTGEDPYKCPHRSKTVHARTASLPRAALNTAARYGGKTRKIERRLREIAVAIQIVCIRLWLTQGLLARVAHHV